MNRKVNAKVLRMLAVALVGASFFCMAESTQTEYAADRWDRMPLASDNEFPVVGLRLCQTPHNESCIVRAEMRIAVAQTHATLDELKQAQTKWQRSMDKSITEGIVVPVMNLEFHGSQAIKFANKGPMSSHIDKIVVTEGLSFTKDGHTIVCNLTAEPGDYHQIEQAFMQFCGDVDILKLRTVN